jgi:PAS domain S-box-containing protein
VDKLGTITYASPSTKRFLGYRPDELIGKRTLDLIVSDDKPRALADFGMALQTKEVALPNVFRIRHKDGTERILEGIGKNLLDDPIVAGFVMNVRDITERKRIEEEGFILAEIGRVIGSTLDIDELYERMAAEIGKLILFDSLRVNLLNAQQDTLNVAYVSGLDILGRKVGESYPLRGTVLEEVIRTKRGMIVQSENVEELINKFPSLIVSIRAGIRSIMSVPLIAHNELIGSLVIRSKKPAAYTEQDLSLAERIGAHIAGPIVNAQLFNDIKKTEGSLRESEERFRSYLEYAPDGVYMSDVKGNFLYGNRKCEEIIGYRREELIGKNFLELNILSENSLNKAAQLLQANIEGKSTGPDEIELISKEGCPIPVEINTSVVQLMGQGIVLAFVRDITDRKQAEGKLLESEGKYRNILESIEDGYFEVDVAGNLTFFNDSVCRMVGNTSAEMMGINYRQYTDKENSRILYQAFNETFRTGEPSKGVGYEIIRKDGAKLYAESSVSLIRNTSGQPIGFRGIMRNITERKHAEKQLQDTLESLRKAVGTTIRVLTSTVETRDPYTAGHQTRSADLARAIGTEMELPQEKIESIRIAGSIHDIGKLSIPAEILSKPTKLSEIEFSLIKEHARKGYEMLKDVESPWPLAEIVYQHHERMDGSGYPRNLKRGEILIEARILAVADVVEAMASHRPYRPGFGIDTALNEIEKNRGIFYDDDVADACLRLFREKGFQLAEA